MTPDGTLQVTPQGEGYYRHNRNEFIVHLPVWINYPEVYRHTGRSTYQAYAVDPTTSSRHTLPITDVSLLEWSNFTDLPHFTRARSRTATVDEQRAFLKQAVVRYLTNEQRGQLNQFGRIPLQ